MLSLCYSLLQNNFYNSHYIPFKLIIWVVNVVTNSFGKNENNWPTLVRVAGTKNTFYLQCGNLYIWRAHRWAPSIHTHWNESDSCNSRGALCRWSAQPRCFKSQIKKSISHHLFDESLIFRVIHWLLSIIETDYLRGG